WVTESGESTPPVDALFTAVSAAAVTGLVTVDTANHWNIAGEAIILLLIQVGGLGFMVGAGLLLQMLRRGQSRLSDVMLMQDGAPTLSPQEAIELTGRIVRFTFVVEGVGAALLTLKFWQDMPFTTALWRGLFHAVSAFCNAGFDLQGNFVSLGPYRSSVAINLIIAGLIQAGALSYIVFADLHRSRGWKALALDTKLVLLVNAIVLFASIALFLVAEWNRSLAGEPAATKGLAALFQGVAARTAGFATIDWSLAQTSTLFLWIVVMAVGGAAGSTAGGIKLATVGVVFMAVISTLRGNEEPRAFGRSIPTTLIMRAVSVIFVFMAVHFVATIALVSTEHFFSDGSIPFLALMYETMSAAATVGLSTGITPSLSDAGKLVLCATMFFGRLGPLTTAYALQRRQRPARYRFPTAQVRIG
ncbi:MAG: Trk family potassium uptake protein, partial [Thermomicrobiales bacterium]|nr:Trk family potassium uptake protein [Thermomicrobiales bacterium]